MFEAHLLGNQILVEKLYSKTKTQADLEGDMGRHTRSRRGVKG